jgi:hypothetical protein
MPAKKDPGRDPMDEADDLGGHDHEGDPGHEHDA